jgi:hypothetical protein
MSVFSFLKKSKSVPPAPRQVIRVIERELGSLTLADWRQDARLCVQARGVLSSPIVRQMLAVLHNSHPAFQVMISGDTNERALQQARCEGYTLALADFEAMGMSQPTNAPLEADFSEEHIPESELKDYMADGRKSA